MLISLVRLFDLNISHHFYFVFEVLSFFNASIQSAFLVVQFFILKAVTGSVILPTVCLLCGK